MGIRQTGSQTSRPHAQRPVRAQPQLPTVSGSPTGQRIPRAGFWKAAQQHLHPDCGAEWGRGVGPGRRAEWSAHPPSSALPLPTCPLPSRPAVTLTLSSRTLWCPWVAVSAWCCRRGPRLVGRVRPPVPGPLSRCPRLPLPSSAAPGCRAGGAARPGAGDTASPASFEALGAWPPRHPAVLRVPGAAGSGAGPAERGLPPCSPRQERTLRVILTASEVRPCGSSCDDRGLQVHGVRSMPSCPGRPAAAADAPLCPQSPPR